MPRNKPPILSARPAIVKIDFSIKRVIGVHPLLRCSIGYNSDLQVGRRAQALARLRRLEYASLANTGQRHE